MAKQRMVDPKFWSDPWIRKLNPLDRYLFLYLLTNERSSWCGVYELDLSVMAFESGIDERDLERSMLLRLSPKIVYVDGWVCLKNWEKYHDNGSEQTKKGIENAWNAVPEEIRRKIKRLSKIDIPPIDPLVAPPSLTSSFTSTSTITSRASQSDAKLIEAVIDLFKEISPTEAPKWFANRTQRSAADRLIVEYGFERVEKAVKLLPKTNSIPYFPTVTTPDQLSKKWPQLQAAFEKQQGKQLTRARGIA